ncbi:MAG: FapA family protein [Desulfobacterales bacterium]|nr:FapA family protein [Desulfobacterales bacterium]
MTDNDQYGILVVDDDEPIVKNMRRVLRRKGFTKVVSALNGEQGTKLLETTRPPFFLVMSDQRMPGMSGSEFLEKSILISPESRRMLITGYSDFDAVIAAVNKGEIHQYISKPWNNDDLLLRIMNELTIYKGFQERKHLYTVTNRQNAKLFDLAATQKKELEKFTARLENRKEEALLLTQAVKDARKEAEFKETFPGLDELLSRTITMNKTNLVQAFKIVRKEVNHLMVTISDRNSQNFSVQDLDKDQIDITALEDETFDMIDQIIEEVVIASESDLFGIGSEPVTGVVVDDYKNIPDFDQLAFNDGFITRGERERALEELEEKEAELKTGLTIDKILVRNGFLRRQDLSRIFAKLAMIETRLLDRELAKIMLNREIASKKDIDRAFRKQLNNFEDSGVAQLMADILVESQIISPETRDEVMALQDRSSTKRPDESSQFSSEFGAFVDLQISENKVQAWIRVPKAAQGSTDIQPIKDLIKKRGITYGIVEDLEIRRFLKECTDPHEKFVVANGIEPSVGKPARIEYHFNTQASTAGVVKEDGSIDFTERGDSPFVRRNQLLAEKHPVEQPKSGMDIFGETLLVGDVDDVPLEGGDGTELSEDGLTLKAAITGQPAIDGKGVIRVLESFTVNGDVDFKTGNINFNGNVIVKGAVKEGFTVECDSLTANEINGGIIRIRGDLNVSNGVVNSDIQTQGSVRAKFLNKVRVYGYEDMMITREIMESRIAISGSLNNETGRITASVIAARKGMSVKQIGTDKAEYSTVKAGTDDHIQWIGERYDARIEKNQRELDLAVAEKIEYDSVYNAYHVDIANQTFAQEKVAKKMDFLENRIPEAKEEEKAAIQKELKELEITIQKADERIKAIFQEQDLAQQQAAECERQIEEISSRIKAVEDEKLTIIGRLEKDEAVAEFKINKRIYTGTRIMGAEASMILKQDMGPSKFTEIDSENPDSPKQLIHQPIQI